MCIYVYIYIYDQLIQDCQRKYSFTQNRISIFHIHELQPMFSRYMHSFKNWIEPADSNSSTGYSLGPVSIKDLIALLNKSTTVESAGFQSNR